jgi:tetratricopeptide (TPR) repeat protein
MEMRSKLVAGLMAAGLLVSVSLVAAEAAAPAAEKKAEAKAEAKAIPAGTHTMKTAKKLLDEEKWEEAAAAYESVGESKTAETWRCNNIGLCYIKLEKFDKAIVALDKAVAADPNNVVAWGNLRTAAEKAWNIEKAVEAYRKVLELSKPAEVKAEESEKESTK